MTPGTRSATQRIAVSSPAGKAGTALLAGAAVLAAAALWNNARARRAERDHPPERPVPRGRRYPAALSRAGRRPAGGPAARQCRQRRGLCPGAACSTGSPSGIASWPSIAPASATAIGRRARCGRRQRRLDLLRRAFARLGLERPVVVGHSWGTLVALALALDHPDAVGGLVLLSGYYKPTARLDVPLAAPPAIPVIGDVMRYTVSPLLGRAMLPLNLKAMFAPQPCRSGSATTSPTAFRSGQGRSAPKRRTPPPWCRLWRRCALATASLRLPVTIMAGTEDKIVDVDGHAVWFHQAMPRQRAPAGPGYGAHVPLRGARAGRRGHHGDGGQAASKQVGAGKARGLPPGEPSGQRHKRDDGLRKIKP